MSGTLFRKILYAYDGSDSALEVFNLALAIAKQNGSELHIVSVGEVDYFPQFVKDIREQRGMAVQRLRSFVFRVRALATGSNVKLHSHVLVGHPVRAIGRLALKLDAELLVIGARGHSVLYERLMGSRAAQIMQVAHCPVLAVKNCNRRRHAKNQLRFTRTWDQIVGAGEVLEKVSTVAS